MNIGKNYKIEGDSFNFTLSKKHTNKTGKVYWSGIAYFSSLKNALDYLVDLEVAETGLTDLKTVVAKQDELYALISKIKGGK